MNHNITGFLIKEQVSNISCQRYGEAWYWLYFHFQSRLIWFAFILYLLISYIFGLKNESNWNFSYINYKVQSNSKQSLLYNNRVLFLVLHFHNSFLVINSSSWSCDYIDDLSHKSRMILQTLFPILGFKNTFHVSGDKLRDWEMPSSVCQLDTIRVGYDEMLLTTLISQHNL